KREHLACDFFDGKICETLFAKLDEESVLGEPACVQIKGNAVTRANVFDLTHVRHRDGLTTARITRHRQHHQRNSAGTHAGDEITQRAHVHIPLERMLNRWLKKFRNRQIKSFGAGVFDVRSSRIKVCVVGDDLAGLAHHREENPFGGAALMRRDDVLESEYVSNAGFKSIKAGATGIRFVAAHRGSPLLGTHRGRSTVGKQVNDDVFRTQQEQVVPDLFQIRVALLARRHSQRFYNLYSERFDYRFHFHSPDFD